MKRIRDFLLAALIAAGCRNGSETAPESHVVRVGDAYARVEVAADPQKRAAGLSGRDEISRDEGMLFIFPEPGRPSFWMKGTTAALSVAFINPEGRISEIQDMKPLTKVCHKPRSPCIMALEMPAGWFERNGVREGDPVALPAELTAIEAK